MRLLKAAQEPCADRGKRTGHRLRRIVTYLPASTGTNYNLVEKVEHDPNEKVIWKIIHSPDGDFVYDYALKSDRRKRRKRCPGCENFLELG
jgi:hypothetical protein